jgi:single-stranded DNA-binding protein
MIRCLVSGTLHDAPQSRTSQNGNAFAVCKVKADDKAGAWVWVSAIAFGDAAERLLQLKAGDSVSLSGRAEMSVWTDKDGNAHPSLSLVADEVAALRAKPKPREESRRPPRRSSRASRERQPETAGGFDDLDDWRP